MTFYKNIANIGPRGSSLAVLMRGPCRIVSRNRRTKVRMQGESNNSEKVRPSNLSGGEECRTMLAAEIHEPKNH